MDFSAARSIVGLLGVLLASAAVHAAGAVQVSFVQPEKFADVGRTPRDVDGHLQQLTRHFEVLAARYLLDGQKLNLEVLDVDLAGELRPSRRSAQEIRVLKGGADWPRIHLRYTLEAAGQAPRRGEAQLRDLAYLQRPAGGYGDRVALKYEYRMLDEWFGTEFGPAGAK
jgi:Protein of unknown function (DUF3016)